MNELFKIFRVNNEVLKDLAKDPNRPHRHNHEEIIVVIKGTLEHFIDFDSTLLHAPFVSFIAKGKTHHIKPHQNGDDCDGYVIRFQSEFVSETIFQLYHYFHDHANISFPNRNEFDRFVTLCEMLDELSQQDSLDYSVISSLLSTILTMLGSEKRKSGNAHSSNPQNSPFIGFLQLLESHYHEPLGVTYYADKLQMSSRNLNLICQQVLQKSISEIIQTRRLIEAKNLLTTTDKSIYEIGFEIGYQEKSYFSNTFKKKTGKTPTEFRNEIKSFFS